MVKVRNEEEEERKRKGCFIAAMVMLNKQHVAYQVSKCRGGVQHMAMGEDMKLATATATAATAR